MKVLLVSSECAPYAKTGGLADLTAALPRALRKIGIDARILMPRYRGVDVSKMKCLISNLGIPIHTRTVYGKVFESTTPDGVPIYFLDQPKYYDRRELYVENGKDYPDNAERFIFFSRAAVEFVRKGVFVPDVLHVNDWFTGLIPVYLRALYSGESAMAEIAVVFSVHNLAYQGVFWHYDMLLTGLSWSLFHYDKLEFYGKINLMKGGLVFSDMISTVSPHYAQEILTPSYGHGLDPILKQRAADLVGIVSGVDYESWNPATDHHLAGMYDVDNLAGKLACKRDLQTLNNLPQTAAPLVGMISRLADQKGFDLVEKIFPQLMERGAQFVLLGNGNERWQSLFRDLARRYPLQVGVNLIFSDELAHKIEAGADIFLIPSCFEPCGSNQFYSLKYGTVPVVRAVGGLADTIREVELDQGSQTLAQGTGNGFRFDAHTPEACWSALERSLNLYANHGAWQKLMRTGMREDWSWDRSATEYQKLYENARSKRRV